MPATDLRFPDSSLHADRSDHLTWKPLRFLTLYRLLLAGLIVALFFTLPALTSLGGQAPWLFGSVAALYFLFALGAGFAARHRRPAFAVQVFVQTLVDIVAILLLMHASGGVDSGLGILLVLAVAGGALLLPGRMAYFFAATASIGLLLELGYRALGGQAIDSGDLTRTGLLGFGLFATAILASFLARRIRETEALAEQRGVDLANLARLNEHVIQRLQSGILVVDDRDRIRLINDTAWIMLGLPADHPAERLAEVSPRLAEQLAAWRADPARPAEPFQPNHGETSLRAHFTPLGRVRGAATLIFLEDAALLEQQAQQLKLAALGRLTASIAHEIRNPLGAISHANQLLAESAHLDADDRRLSEIIANHAERVNTIVENVLALSRRGRTEPQPIRLADWLADFRDELVRCGGITPERLALEVDPPDLTVSFDPNQLYQVVWNLVQNALRHAGTGQRPAEVTLSARRSEAGVAWLDVIDNGRGIDAEGQARIFEPFYTTTGQGTGLGLYLARELCEANRARLNYVPGRRRGACFRISFSRAPATETDEA